MPIIQHLGTAYDAGGGGLVFDEYGSMGDTADTLTSITQIAYKDGSGNGTDAWGSACMKNKATAAQSYSPGDYDNVMIYNIDSSYNTERFYPSGGASNWTQVSSSSDIGTDTLSHGASSGSNMGYHSIGNIWHCGTGGVHAAAKGYIKVQMQSSGGDNAPYVEVRSDDSPYPLKQYNQNFYSNTFRFNEAVDTLDLTVMQVTKDQAGGWSSGTGQPTMLTGYNIKDHNANGGMYNGFPGQNSNDLSFWQNTNQNTHGMAGRAAFLGGRLNGSDREMYYITFYNNHSNGADGCRYCKITASSSGAINVNWIGPHFNYTVADTAGYIPTCKPGIWPHGIATRSDGNYTINNSSNNLRLYYNLANITSSSTGIEDMGTPSGTSGQIECMAVIGTWSGGTKPVIAFYDKSDQKVSIRRYNPGVGWDSLLAKIPSGISGTSYVTGIFPVAGTNRILLGKAPGVTVLEVA
tara:strand:+ start:151 stop:1542 length:1392 start_codon:yes stop_codon:yes gene_type:complete